MITDAVAGFLRTMDQKLQGFRSALASTDEKAAAQLKVCVRLSGREVFRFWDGELPSDFFRSSRKM